MYKVTSRVVSSAAVVKRRSDGLSDDGVGGMFLFGNEWSNNKYS